jgi:hypothetical protein
MSSTAAATLRQLVMFIVDEVIKEDRYLLLASELESIILLDGTAQSLGLQRATRSPSAKTHACWETATVCSPSNISTRRFP